MPAWPVVGLTFEGGTAVADAAGVGDPIRVAAYPDLATASASAAAAAARRLNVKRCRVQGVSPDGEVWVMVVDAETETLEDLDSASADRAAAKVSRSPLSRRLSVVPQRWWLVIGVAAVAAVTIAVVIVPRGMLPAPSMDGPAVEDEIPTPDAGQLPISAPVGWDTYASWVIDSAKPGAAAVLAHRDVLVLSDGADVIAIDVETGQLRWRSGTAGDVTALYAPVGTDVIYAARSNTGVSVLDRKTGTVLSDGVTSAREIVLGDVPYAELPGQAGAVLIGTSWERRQVPATSVPVGTAGEGLVNVSIEQENLWVTTSNSPVLPTAVPLQAPADGLSLSRTVAFVDGRLILEWADRFGPQTFTIDTVSADGTLERVGTFDATGRSSGKSSVDVVNGLVGIGSLLLDVNSQTVTESAQGTVVTSAGYGWTEQAGSGRVRINPDGSTLPLRSGAVIPDVILPDGRAVVRAARGSDGNAYYVLEVQQPTPTATPEPTPTDGKEQ
ncbi:MAG: hypothetical protein ACTH8F_07570 [Microbacterium sp.]|uniref:hypothetical protein n=1 Tax=Microbacterium sp. TaxID=51671 RepID=UPI003F99C7F2